jgi:hypothetical protein
LVSLNGIEDWSIKMAILEMWRSRPNYWMVAMMVVVSCGLRIRDC